MSDSVRQFTASGNEAFHDFLKTLSADPMTPVPVALLQDRSMTSEISFTAEIERLPDGKPFPNRYEFGSYLVAALSNADRSQISFDSGLWNWLALYYFDQLCPPTPAGGRKTGEIAAYYLPDKYQHNRYYRHLVRSPWLAVLIHEAASRVILLPLSTKGPPLAVRGEIFEQVASRQGLFRSPAVIDTVFRLYFDTGKGRPRHGTAGSAAGSPRRLGQILKQLELTHDLGWGDGGMVVKLLPTEFAKWTGDSARGTDGA